MMKVYHVRASNFHGTYSAGTYAANSRAEAIEMARREYANSPMGRDLHDVGAFRFYVTSEEHESAND